MKTIKKRILKPFLFICLSLTVVTIVYARVSITVASPPGRPEATDIWADGCRLKYLPPLSNGGAPVFAYTIEGRNKLVGRWVPKGSSQTLDHRINNNTYGATYDFRVSAENAAGLSRPSQISNPITFRDPY